MSIVNVTNVIAGPEASAFTDPFNFSISFEAIEALKSTLVWKVTYVGQADSDEYDQQLEEIEMPVHQPGSLKFDMVVSIFS